MNITPPTAKYHQKGVFAHEKTNIIATGSVLIALVCAALLFISWNPEALLKLNEPMVSTSDIEQNITTDFSGSPAGADIPRLTGAEDFSDIIYLSDYVTAEPVGIVQTGISSLSPWEDHCLPDLSKCVNLQNIFLIGTGIDIKALPDHLQEKVRDWDDR